MYVAYMFTLFTYGRTYMQAGEPDSETDTGLEAEPARLPAGQRDLPWRRRLGSQSAHRIACFWAGGSWQNLSSLGPG